MAGRRTLAAARVCHYTAGMTLSAQSPAPGAIGRSLWTRTGADRVGELTVGALLQRAAMLAPDTVALVEGVPDRDARRRWTYAELLADAERAARALLGRFAPGERIAVWANNIPEWLLLQTGAAAAGLTLVTVDPALRRDEVAHVLRRSEAAGVFLVREYRGNPMAETVTGLRAELPALRGAVLFEDWAEFVDTGDPALGLPVVSPCDAAQIQFTSGTTGLPKGAVLHHRGQVNSACLSYGELLGIRPGDPMVNVMPMFHTAGSVLATLSAIGTCATQVLQPWFDPALYLRLIEEERSILFGGVPTMLLATLDHPAMATTDTSSVRVALSGGATVPPALVRRVEATLGVPMGIIYAQTEASPAITMTAPYADSADDRATTLGRPLPAIDVAIMDPVDRRTPVLPGVVGELCTRGYHVMTGYVGDPEQTAAAVDDDGWLHTGDLASMDERGYCRIEGRLKEMIIRGGENVFPREIEDVLLGHPDIADVAVVGVPDELWGEQVGAAVRLREGAVPDEAALVAWGRERLAPHKVPRVWRFVDSFPTTTSGKIRKHLIAADMVDSAQDPREWQ
ncbi:AMP-binding protein [Pseudonocardia sulfidoxydans NBRC 16205]|uniref:AMP-binding protein n=1 Tax=Pseudonocardia sulfidoxydans NBRC 16205 TaxID=1223511 RepID=A0A511DR59_9PSEU|nr:AMP-binding protein [Pseudonocardia sulfidoxydans]GEL26234.1 AMP-binding protein [Pseudonocardia sulfidoxydans NBRC 16205]